MALTHVWLIEDYKSKNFEIKDTDLVIDVGNTHTRIVLFDVERTILKKAQIHSI